MRPPLIYSVSRRVSRGKAEPKYALSFDGVDDWVDLGVDRIHFDGGSVGLFADPSEQWTVEIAVLVRPGGGHIISKASSTAENTGRFFIANTPGRDYLRMMIRGLGANMTSFPSSDSRWRRYATTYDGESVILWEPGMRSDVKSIGSGSDTNETIKLGCQVPGSRHFDGMIRNVRIWNRVLSLSEIMEYRNVRLKGDEPGLIAYWPMDEGQGDVCYDHGPFGHHALIHGATWVEV